MSVAVAHEPSANVAVWCDAVVHIYRADDVEQVALRGIDLTVTEGESVALLGPSGAGKSTLLWLLAGLLTPSAGKVQIFEHEMHRLEARQLGHVRASTIGVVLQNPGRNLLTYATAAQNVGFARRRGTSGLATGELLDAVGLSDMAKEPAGGLSGGEQQRLAVAVALANQPRLLLADEPTSQLDPESAQAVVGLLARVSDDFGTTVVVVTHDAEVSESFGRTVTIRDGVVGAEGRRGEDFVVVGKDGGLQLPPDMREHLPPGTLARVMPTEHGVELRVYDPEADQ